MKLLLFSDLHCDAGAARRLIDRAAAADVLVGAGDFATMRRGIDVCIDVLRQVPTPCVLVPGNNESLEELRAACRSWPTASVLHGTGIEIDGVNFFGLGGGVPVTPFGSWSYDFAEEQAAQLLAHCPTGGVLVSHSPPKGAVDATSHGQSLGSTAVFEAIMRTRPRLVVCGHIHESSGRTALVDSTPVVNAGPGGVEWELSEVSHPTQ